MADKKLVEWIKSEEAQGYSEEKLRQVLLSQGYVQKDIDEAINSTKKTNPEFLSKLEELMSKKKFFKFLVYNGLTLLTLIILFPFIVLIPVNVFLNLKLSIYLFILIYSLISGFFIFYIYYNLNDKFEKILYYGVKSSVMLAIIFSINTCFYYIIKLLNSQFSKISSTVTTASSFNLFNSNMINPYIGFIMSLILFNIPFFIYYFRAEGKKIKLLWYILPILVFALLTFIGLFLVTRMFFSEIGGI